MFLWYSKTRLLNVHIARARIALADRPVTEIFVHVSIVRSNLGFIFPIWEKRPNIASGPLLIGKSARYLCSVLSPRALSLFPSLPPLYLSLCTYIHLGSNLNPLLSMYVRVRVFIHMCCVYTLLIHI